MKLPENITRSVGRAVLQAKKNSPHLFFAGGVAGVVGTVYLACKATLKLEETLDEIKEDVETVKELATTSETNERNETYTQGDHYKDVGYVLIKSGGKLVRLYGPAAILGAASIGALTGSHVQLTRRNAALSATVALVSKALEDYRQRVKEQFGEDKELDIYRGNQLETVEVDGKKQKVVVTNPDGKSMYARCFNDASRHWENNHEMNRMFLEHQQNYANQLLYARGHVFLNDIYDALGFERTSAGQIVGWLLNGEGDGHVDFGIYEARNIHFLNGNDFCWLDFNVDGPIYEMI
jgi:hypothetical protein